MSYSYGYGGGDKVEGTRVVGERSFVVDTAKGPVEVVADDLAWASTAVVNTRSVGSTRFEIIESIPAGGRVAALGTIEPGAAGQPLRLIAPAILLATDGDDDPQRLAAILARDRLVTQLGLVVASVALVATHLVF
jgi:hypothetical protein